MSLSGGTAYVDVALGKTQDFAKGMTSAGEQGAETAKSSFLSRIGTMAIGSALGGALTSGVSSAVGFAKDSVIGFNSQLQQATIGFTTMLGSSQKAGAYIQQLQQFAKTTPFEFGNLVQNAQQMMGMGIAAQDVVPDLKALGDSVASIGGSAQQVDSVTLAFDQMNAKGTLDMGNMNQLMQNGVPSALKVLAAHYKVTTGEMITMISTGKVQASEALPALVSGIEKGTNATAALGGMMDKQSQTMAGALSNIKDSATQAMAGAFKPLFDAASGAAQGLANVLGSGAVTKASKAISDGLSSAFGYASSVMELFMQGWKQGPAALDAATPLLRFGAEVKDTFDKVKGYIGDAFGYARSVMKMFMSGWSDAGDSLSAATPLVRFGAQAKSTFDGVMAKGKDLIDQAAPIGREVFGKIEDAVRHVGPVLQELFLDKINTIKTIIGDAIPIVENIARNLGPILGEVLRAAGDLIEQHLLPAFLKISQFITQNVVPAVADFVAFAVQKVMPLFHDIADVITQKVMPIIGKLADLFVQKVLPALQPLIKDGFAFLKDAIEKLTPIVQDLVHWFADNVLPVLAKVATFLIGTLIPFVAQVADVLLKILKPAFDYTVMMLRDVVMPVLKFVAGLFLGLVNGAVDLATGVIKAIQGIVAIFVWLKTETGKIFDWIGTQWDNAVSAVASIPGKLAKAGAGMWDWMKNEFRVVLNAVIGWWDSLNFTTPKIHIPGTPSSWDIGSITIGMPQIPKLATGGLVMPTPGGSIVRVAEAGVPEIVAPERSMEAAVSRALAAHGGIGRDSPLIGTVNMPDGIGADEIAERLYFKATARGVSF